MRKLAILGTGSWGLTLAWLLAATDPKDCQTDVWLWSRSAEKISALKANRTVTFPVSLTLPDSITLTDSLTDAVTDADAVLLVVTSEATRSVARQLKSTTGFSNQTVVINASKGIELSSLKPMSAVIAEELPENPFAALSGPTLATEILNGLPTACCVTSLDACVAQQLQSALSRETFRLYSNTDVIGVELGGALKNVFAIASGYMQAQRLGENAKAALITRGLAEMTRFSVALGAEEQTLFGLSGLGDLLATCNSPLSRNFQVGFQLAQGKPLDEILTNLRMVAEGVNTTRAVSQISKDMGIDTPVVRLVEAALNGALSKEDMIRSLMSRKLKAEHY
jgi:glycerol-3-phosphate dehydrogenase (NAD(P)+)